MFKEKSNGKNLQLMVKIAWNPFNIFPFEKKKESMFEA